MDKPIFIAEEITKIYVGGDNVCRCGCAGEYVNRGEPKFDKRLKRFERLWKNYAPQKYDVDGSYLNITTSQSSKTGRAITVYFD